METTRVTFKYESSTESIEVTLTNLDYISDYIDNFKSFLLAVGFQPETVKEYLER